MKKTWHNLIFVLLVGCAATSRDCASCNASSFGSDWVVLQYGFDGKPINCWKLIDTAVSNEHATDGIFWQDSKSRHLVHISGWYNRVQVSGGDFEGAARAVGVDIRQCAGGKYAPTDGGN